jgi:hypothetical protein
MRVEHLLRLCAVFGVSPTKLLPPVSEKRKVYGSLAQKRAEAKVEATKRKLDADRLALARIKKAGAT